MLNHGSFGACPRVVLQRQRELRCQMEARPVQFLVRQMPELLDASRQRLAETIGADPQDLVFVSNATAGVNSVLRSLRFRAGDEILVTMHGYNACNNVARFVAQQSRAALVVAEIPSPVESPQQVVDAVMSRVSPRTRIALLDHISSPSAFVFPIEPLVARLHQQGIETLIDGAHAPGMVPVDLRRIGATYYTGNCHKWLCARGGPGFSMSGAIGRRRSSRRSSATATTGRGPAIAVSRIFSTGPARSTRRPGSAWARRSIFWRAFFPAG